MQVAVARVDGDVAHRHLGQPAGEPGPAPAAVHRDVEAEFGAQEEEVRVHQVLPHHVGVAREWRRSPAASRSCRSRPSGRRRSSCRRVGGRRRWRRRSPSSKRPASTHDTQVPFGSPATFGATFVQVLPPSRVTWRLPSSVPTQITCGVLRRLADREDRGVVLGRRVVDREAARLHLLLLLRIVGREVGRDPLPGVAAVARAEEELRAEVDRLRIGRAGLDRRVPVEPERRLARARRAA